MPSSLALHLLGTPQLYLNDAPITFQRRKSLALLAYLACERRDHLRDTLSALLWPDHEQSKAFANLRQALWEIQKSIGEDWLNTRKDKIGLEEISDTRPFIEQADVDKIIAACLAKMGEAEFSDAYDDGKKMTLDEAAAFVLGEN
jgi:DNA-binding SARP family transcriptional activator